LTAPTAPGDADISFTLEGKTKTVSRLVTFTAPAGTVD